MKKIFLVASVALVALSSCQKEKDKKQTIFIGEVKEFQHGKAWTWYETDKNSRPLRLAVAIDDAVMAGLDRGHGEGSHNHENSLSLDLHPKTGEATPFKHVLMDWNPAGHPPAGVYMKPHFDFHFYTTTAAERKIIPPYPQAADKFDNLPFDYMPADYVPIPEGVPQMGKHWVYKFAPELAGAEFTETFMYGSYNGKVTFYEPMITEAFLLANPNFVRDVPVPAKFQVSGWYPTKMRIAKKHGTTNIILEEFVQRTAN